MPFTKLFHTSTNSNQDCVIQIHDNHPNHSFQGISEMVKELKKDFRVDDSNIDVRQYAGISMRGRTYIETRVSFGTKKPKDYDETPYFEKYLY